MHAGVQEYEPLGSLWLFHFLEFVRCSGSPPHAIYCIMSFVFYKHDLIMQIYFVSLDYYYKGDSVIHGHHIYEDTYLDSIYGRNSSCAAKSRQSKIISQWAYEFSSNFLQLSTTPLSDLSFASCLGSCVYHSWLGTIIVMHALNN